MSKRVFVILGFCFLHLRTINVAGHKGYEDKNGFNLDISGASKHSEDGDVGEDRATHLHGSDESGASCDKSQEDGGADSDNVTGFVVNQLHKLRPVTFKDIQITRLLTRDMDITCLKLYLAETINDGGVEDGNKLNEHLHGSDEADASCDKSQEDGGTINDEGAEHDEKLNETINDSEAEGEKKLNEHLHGSDESGTSCDKSQEDGGPARLQHLDESHEADTSCDKSQENGGHVQNVTPSSYKFVEDYPFHKINPKDEMSALFGNHHYSQPLTFTDLGRRRFIPYSGKQPNLEEEAELKLDTIMKKHLATWQAEDSGPTPVKAPLEIVVAIAKKSALGETSKPKKPSSNYSEKDILRTGNYWNDVWKEDVDMNNMLRNKKKNGIRGAKVEIEAGSKLHTLVSALKKISPRLLYVINKND